ncbi:hypothetical protein FRC12_003236 [Ceratobasidium sp. 428]|nr:hypothetical protein FRC12_003236 [Ceratobasidium sp. 428]
MNSHFDPQTQPYELYEWQGELPATSTSTPASTFGAPLAALPEHGFAMARPGSFAEFSPLDQRAFLHTDPYPGSSPVSASPSGGSSPWSTASFPTQDVMFHPELTKFNRGSRGSMNSLALPSMRSSSAGIHAYTPGASGRPHAMSLSHVEVKEEHPWNLVSWQPFNQDGAAPGTAAFFLRSPTPTKRQRTNQACEKCRERKAKCNGARPTCQRCQARGHICEYAKERRMRGPNRTGRRSSQPDIDEPVEGVQGAVDGSETVARSGADSPTSTSSPRSSSEVTQELPSGEQSKQAQDGTRQQANRARSDSGSPASLSAGLPSPQSTTRERPASASAPIALPTLTNGNLSLHPRLDQRAAPSESALRYAQSMPHIGFRYGQDAFLREEQPTVWSTTLDAPSMSDISRVDEPHSSPSEYPLSDMQMHFSDVSSSSTPITPDRFDYPWSADEAAAQQSAFQFVDTKPASMLPTLPEFDGETGQWAETHADDHPVIMAENVQRNALAL